MCKAVTFSIEHNNNDYKNDDRNNNILTQL